jgi:uncharacterized protein
MEGELSNRLTLTGGRCVCGYVFYPHQSYGCEQCGSQVIEEIKLSGFGTVLASVRVHRHTKPDPSVPFIIATVMLDEGPVFRGLLESAEPVFADTQVQAVLVHTAGDTAMSVHFKVIQGQTP